jgi:hypothetical protein
MARTTSRTTDLALFSAAEVKAIKGSSLMDSAKRFASAYRKHTKEAQRFAASVRCRVSDAPLDGLAALVSVKDHASAQLKGKSAEVKAAKAAVRAGKASKAQLALVGWATVQNNAGVQLNTLHRAMSRVVDFDAPTAGKRGRQWGKVWKSGLVTDEALATFKTLATECGSMGTMLAWAERGGDFDAPNPKPTANRRATAEVGTESATVADPEAMATEIEAQCSALVAAMLDETAGKAFKLTKGQRNAILAGCERIARTAEAAE